MRIPTIRFIDRLLYWIFRKRCLPVSSLKKKIEQKFHSIHEFVEKFGYFSKERPLLGRVSRNLADIVLVDELFGMIHRTVSEPSLAAAMTAEALAKMLAYRELKEGMTVSIPDAGKLLAFEVDRVFDIWHGMPAFGLSPKDKGSAAPILLYRGTDFSLRKIRSWASLISDVDTHGPGFYAFQQGRPEIRAWLSKQAASGCKARAMGFSLGGALVAYTLFYESGLIHESTPSFSFNPPGLSEIFKDWKPLSPLNVYITQGDLVSTSGCISGTIQECALDRIVHPIEAHTSFIFAQPTYFIS